MEKVYFILIVFLGFMTCIPTLATNGVNKNSSSKIRSKGICRELILNSLRRSDTNKKTVKPYQDKDFIRKIFDFRNPSPSYTITNENNYIHYRTNSLNDKKNINIFKNN